MIKQPTCLTKRQPGEVTYLHCMYKAEDAYTMHEHRSVHIPDWLWL